MVLFITMLSNAVLMTLVIVLFLLIRIPLQRRIRPAACYAMGIIVVVGLLIPFRPTFSVPLLPAPKPIQQMISPELELPDTIPYYYDFSSEEHQKRLVEAQRDHEPVLLDTSATSPASSVFWGAAMIVWLAGMIASLSDHTIRHFRFRHMIKRWHNAPSYEEKSILLSACALYRIKNPPRLWKCSVVQSPLLVGIARPMILLPDHGFCEEELINILQHELIHLKRRDLWGKTLVLASVCLHWWNPLVRRLAHAVSLDCEMACDDAVLLGTDIARRKQYGETILSAISRQAMPYPAISTYFYERKMDMKRRFASMLTVRPRRTGACIVLLCMCLTLFTGSIFALGTESSHAQGAQRISPTTGMQYPKGRDDAYRPILVEISNTEESRPQLAMSMADIVYEYIFWGPGHTRYLALFNDYHPEMVGAIRSSKILGMELRNVWDGPIVFMGGDGTGTVTNTYAFVEAHTVPASMLLDGTDPISTSEDMFSRIAAREVPNNAVANLKKLIQTYWPKGTDGALHEPALPTLRFDSKPFQGEVTATELIIPYDERAYLARYAYDAADGHYKRWYNGAPHLDGLTGQQFIASNVIVQYVEHSYHNASMAQPLWTLIGEGKLDVFVGGQHMAGTWRRSDNSSAFEYLDQDGNPLMLCPGKTFIQMVPLDMQIFIGNKP